MVLAGPADAAQTIDIKPGFDLAAALKGAKLAMADPDSVPARKYGKAALEKLGVWNSVARAEKVRAALLLVSRREAPRGIVYQTDVAADPGTEAVGVLPRRPACPDPARLALGEAGDQRAAGPLSCTTSTIPSGAST